MKQSKYEDMFKAIVSCSTFFFLIITLRKGNKTNELNKENMIHIYCVMIFFNKRTLIISVDYKKAHKVSKNGSSTSVPHPTKGI